MNPPIEAISEMAEKTFEEMPPHHLKDETFRPIEISERMDQIETFGERRCPFELNKEVMALLIEAIFGTEKTGFHHLVVTTGEGQVMVALGMVQILVIK